MFYWVILENVGNIFCRMIWRYTRKMMQWHYLDETFMEVNIGCDAV